MGKVRPHKHDHIMDPGSIKNNNYFYVSLIIIGICTENRKIMYMTLQVNETDVSTGLIELVNCRKKK